MGVSSSTLSWTSCQMGASLYSLFHSQPRRWWWTKTCIEPITTMGKEVGIVDNYKYLGVHINNRLDWTGGPTLMLYTR
ncbi:hypothetical protein QTP70_025282, partial [Hemibagrus guttatus]